MIPSDGRPYAVVGLRGEVAIDGASTLIGEARADTLLIGVLTRQRHRPATYSSLSDEEVSLPLAEEDTLIRAVAVLQTKAGHRTDLHEVVDGIEVAPRATYPRIPRVLGIDRLEVLLLVGSILQLVLGRRSGLAPRGIEAEVGVLRVTSDDEGLIGTRVDDAW